MDGCSRLDGRGRPASPRDRVAALAVGARHRAGRHHQHRSARPDHALQSRRRGDLRYRADEVLQQNVTLLMPSPYRSSTISFSGATRLLARPRRSAAFATSKPGARAARRSHRAVRIGGPSRRHRPLSAIIRDAASVPAWRPHCASACGNKRPSRSWVRRARPQPRHPPREGGRAGRPHARRRVLRAPRVAAGRDGALAARWRRMDEWTGGHPTVPAERSLRRLHAARESTGRGRGSADRTRFKAPPLLRQHGSYPCQHRDRPARAAVWSARLPFRA